MCTYVYECIYVRTDASKNTRILTVFLFFDEVYIFIHSNNNRKDMRSVVVMSVEIGTGVLSSNFSGVCCVRFHIIPLEKK